MHCCAASDLKADWHVAAEQLLPEGTWLQIDESLGCCTEWKPGLAETAPLDDDMQTDRSRLRVADECLEVLAAAEEPAAGSQWQQQ